MTIAFHPAMTEALRLTRAGDLAEATALIQRTLTGAAAPEPSLTPPADDGLIDLKPDRVTVSPRRRTPAPEARTSGDPGGGFEKRTYRGPEGVLAYHLHVPNGATAAMPLIVMLHGCTQSPEDFARGTGMNRLADEQGFLVAYPGQTKAAHPQKCWNWFRPGDQRRDRGEPALIAGVTRQVIAEHRVDPDRIYIAGLSAGGAAAAIMGAAYPDLFAAIGIHSGLACGAARDLPSALNAMRNGGEARASGGVRFVPVITFHGDGDTIVHERNSRAIVAAASAGARVVLATRAETGRTAGGREYTREISTDAAGRALIERWTIHGAGHAWSGGDRAGSYTDPSGPDASREMLRFLLEHRIDRDGGGR